MVKKKVRDFDLERKRGLIDMEHPNLSLSCQCELLSLCRSTLYYSGRDKDFALDRGLTKLIDQKYLECPFYGSRRMTTFLQEKGFEVNRKRICRLMNEMGIQAIYPRKKLSQRHPGHRVYPYLLKGLAIVRVNQVWSTDITFIPMSKGFIYLVAIMDWYSRYVVSWEVSLTMEKEFCISALERALEQAKPEIFNSDQGSQFTSPDFTQILISRGISISMDGRGRVYDNIFIERLWRTVKQEEVYLKDYETIREAIRSLDRYFDFYNNQRYHQGLGNRKPVEVYFGEEVLN